MKQRRVVGSEMKLVADKRAEKLALEAAEIRRELAGATLLTWQIEFCQWLAAHPGVKRQRQVDAASALAGTEISYTQLKSLKLTAAWRELWRRLRDIEKQEAAKAREKYATLLPKAAQAHEDALGALYDEAGKMTLEAARAAPPLLGPLIDRAWPKQTGQPVTVATQVQIVLTPGQARGLNAPEFTVTAAEILPDDEAA